MSRSKNPKPRKRSAFARLPMRTRRAISGYLFILPFIVGFLFFMVSPLFMSLQMSFSKVNSETIKPSDFYMDSYLGYGPEVTLKEQIPAENLPDILRYNQEKLENHEYVVERIDEVLTLKSDFSYGNTVALKEKIKLPSYVWFNPTDLKDGKYNVEQLEDYLQLGNAFTLGNLVPLSRKVDLPSNFQYNATLEKQGVYAVELVSSLLTLDADFTFGNSITTATKIDLPEGYSYIPDNEAAWVFAKDAGFTFGPYVAIGEQIELPTGYKYLPKEEADWVFARDNRFTFGESIVLNEVIELPEGYHYLSAEDAAWTFAREAGFEFGEYFAVSEEIVLPKGYRYLSADEAAAAAVPEDMAGKLLIARNKGGQIPVSFASYLIDNGYGAELMNAIDASIPENLKGASIIKADNGKKIPLTFADHLISLGRYDLLVELSAAKRPEKADTHFIVVADNGAAIDLSFGDYLLENGHGDLLYKVIERTIPSKQKEAGILKADDGSKIPLSFGVYLFDNGHTDLLKAAVEAVKPNTKIVFGSSPAYDKALYEAEGKLAVKAVVPAELLVHLLKNGHSDLFVEVVASAKGLSDIALLHLPETFTYDKALFESEGKLAIMDGDKALTTLDADLSFGKTAVLDQEIELPAGFQYNAAQLAKGVYAVEDGTPVISLPYDFSFGESVTISREVKLPKGYAFDADQQAQGVYVVSNGDKGVGTDFVTTLFNNKDHDVLAEIVAAATGCEPFEIPATAFLDADIYKAKEGIVYRDVLGLDFAAALIDNGQLDVFTELTAQALGLTETKLLTIPEHFTYNSELYTGKKELTIQVASGTPVSTDFATYLIANGYSEVFYETVDPVANSTEVCSLYKPVYQDGTLTAIEGELPADITYDEALYTSEGVISVSLKEPNIPLSFAKTLMSNGQFFSTITDVIGIDNYKYMLTVEPTFNQLLVDELVRIITHTIAILVVAFVIAILLNQEFKGRGLVRAIFFLPVILSSGVLVNLEADNTLMQGMQDLIKEETPFTVTDSMMDILRLTGMGGDLLDVVFELIAEVYDIIMSCGIQIIVFLSGLQNVPASLYEAADVEGCTKWESFWMITFPLVSPLLIVNIIYTIVDFFSKMEGDLAKLLDDALLNMQYDYAATMSWIYTFVTLALIAVSTLILAKVVKTDE